MSGHGHVTPNPDGSRARCGGPAICPQCSLEKARAQSKAENTAIPEPTIQTIKVGINDRLLLLANVPSDAGATPEDLKALTQMLTERLQEWWGSGQKFGVLVAGFGLKLHVERVDEEVKS